MGGVRNHPLVGQRVRLTGAGWAPSARGEVHRIDEIDDDGDAVFGDGSLYYANVTDPNDDYAGDVVHTIFGSRPRNLDPLPYVDGHRDSAGNARRFAEPYHFNGDGTDCPWCVTRYAPREGYDFGSIHQVNPVLAAFRRDCDEMRGADGLTAAQTAQSWVRGDSVEDHRAFATPEQLDHAQRVIERLAGL